jgi:hypothetical protein
MKKNEMGGSCGTYGGREVHIGLLWGRPEEADLEDLIVDGRLIRK